MHTSKPASAHIYRVRSIARSNGHRRQLLQAAGLLVYSFEYRGWMVAVEVAPVAGGAMAGAELFFDGSARCRLHRALAAADDPGDAVATLDARARAYIDSTLPESRH